MPRVRALVEILICSGFPTQLLILGSLRAAGLVARGPGGELSLAFISVLSLVDAALVVSLVILFLRANREQPRHVLLGVRPARREAARGVLLIPISFCVAIGTMVLVNLVAPWLHNVPRNPFEGLLRTPGQQLVLAFVVTLAGGLREEIQRAFILHRFEQSLGGALLGLGLWSLVFGLGHIDQGRDVAITTAVLGAFWGLVYLRRRSAVSPAVAHAGFNLSEILRHVLFAA